MLLLLLCIEVKKIINKVNLFIASWVFPSLMVVGGLTTAIENKIRRRMGQTIVSIILLGQINISGYRF